MVHSGCCGDFDDDGEDNDDTILHFNVYEIFVKQQRKQ